MHGRMGACGRARRHFHVALLYRLRQCEDCLALLIGQALAFDAPQAAQGRLIRLIDTTTVPKAGTLARRENKLWRIHSAFDLPNERFGYFELTDEKGRRKARPHTGRRRRNPHRRSRLSATRPHGRAPRRWHRNRRAGGLEECASAWSRRQADQFAHCAAQRPDRLMQDRSPPTRRNFLATHSRAVHSGHGLRCRLRVGHGRSPFHCGRDGLTPDH